MSPVRMADLVERYGPQRIIVDSSGDWGISDPLAVPRTAHLMLSRGIAPAAVEAVTWGNAIAAYSQSGQIDVQALGETPIIDQRALFEDNSVLRGQVPRVEQAVELDGVKN
jgi:hypothetical protein